MGSAAKVVVLVAGAVVGAGIGLIFTDWSADQSQLLPAAVATGLCLSSAIVTLLMAEAITRDAPQFGPVAVMVGTGVRMAVAVVGVVLLAEVLARYGTPRDRFAEWVAYLYIVTLAVECGLLMASASRVPSGTERAP